MRLLFCLTFLLGAAIAQAQTSIHAVYFAQTHVLKATDPYFGMVGNREALIKVHVVNPASPASPTVTATLTASGLPNLVLNLTGPPTLPASIPDGLGVVQHSFANTFTGYIPANYMKTGLQVTVNAGAAVSTTISNMKVGAPNKVVMTMLDVHYFSQTTGNYPNNTFAEIEAKWPTSDLEVRRLSNVVFPELVIPPRGGAPATRIKSKAEYTAQTGLAFDGEQAAALEWNAALKRAAGRSGRWSLYYMNIYNANAGGQAGGFAGVGNGTSVGILHHELGHALSLPHWGDSSAYPYKGDMHGILAPSSYNETHAGPAWAFDLRTKAFIPPTVQANNVGGNPAGTYKVDPMQGGGTGYQEPAYRMNHFSDYSVNQMRSYLHSHMVVWNPALGSNGNWAAWNQTAGDYITTVSNDGVQFPTTRDTQVISIMATMSGVKPDVNMVYPPIGPYTSGLIRLFDPTVAADRTAANSFFSPSTGSDYCVRVVQGGVTKTYMLAASALTSPALTDASSIETEAINLPASGGAVTKLELLSTPNAEDNGLPSNPTVLYTWLPLAPEVAAFEISPTAYSTSTVSMQAAAGELAPGYTGTLEYRFTETTGNPGASSSGWQTSRTYTDSGLQAGTAYAYTVEMRAGALAAIPSAEFSVTTPYAAPTQGVTVNSTQQFSLQTGSGLKSVTGLGTFNASGSSKLVVVISTEDANNAGTGYVHEVLYNGKAMTQAIQEDGGSNDGSAAIFYLDNPGSIGTGTLQVSAENPNGGIGCAYALSNTMPGFGASNKRSGTTANSVSLTTLGDGSVVIAVLDNAGKPNSVGTTHTATSPLIQASSGTWGSQWGGHASGHRSVASPTAITTAFTTATGTDYNINIAAAEFPAQPPTPNRWIQTAGGSQNWTTGTNWEDGFVPNPGSATTMDFSSVNIAANTNLTLGADRTAQLWKFGDTSGSQSWTVNSGNTLTLAGSAPGFQINNGTTQIDSVIAGTAGLSKTGAGNLTITAANTYTGPTLITAGTLRIGNGGTTGSLDPTSTITNHASLVFNRTNTVTQGTDFASVISGTGSLTKNNTGTLILGGDNTYSGATTISAGILQIGNGGTTGKLALSSAITNNAALVFNRSNGIIQGSGFADGIAGSGSVTHAGNGSLTLNSPNTYEGLTTVSAGAIKVQDTAALGSSATGTIVHGSGNASTSNARLELEGGITVNGEALTINGAGNFHGALSSTSGSNTWAGNVTIGSAGTRIGATTGNTLTVSGTIDSGAIETGLIIRTADLTSTVVLSGANTYLGDTSILIGKLQISGADDRLPVASRLTLGSSGSNADAEFDLNGRNQKLAGIELLPTATAAKNSVNNSSATLSTLAVDPVTTSTFGGIIKGNLNLLKTGPGTFVLSGANTYSGTTSIDNGILQIATANLSLAGNLNFGSTPGSTNVGSLDLSASSATFGGAFQALTNSTNPNTVTIGSGRTLLVNGAFTVGFNPTALPHATTEVDIAGTGTFSIGTANTPTHANFQIGNGQTTNVGNAGILDMSGLTNFYANLGTGLFRVGSPINVGSANGGGSTVRLAANNTIQAATMLLGGPDGSANSGEAAIQSLKLGSGTNMIHVDTLSLGGLGSADGRSNGSLTFNGASGTLKIRSQTDPVNGRATLNIGVVNMNTGVNQPNHLFDTTGHGADLKFGTMSLGFRTQGVGTTTARFNFDTGILDANDLIAGSRSGTAGATANATGIVQIGGGTASFNTTNSPIQLGVNALGSGTATGTLTISGGNVSVAANAGHSIRLGHATAAGGTATGILNLSGGTLAVAGDIIRGTATGTSSAIVNLSGGTLDMGGHDIGTSGTGAVTLNALNGTLKNTASINGSSGLTKTSDGILNISGINSWSGATTISQGVLRVESSGAIPKGTGKGDVVFNNATNTAILDLNGTDTLINGLTQANASTSNLVVNHAASGTATLTVGGNHANSTFAGILADNTGTGGTLALAKTGNGTLTLGGSNTYTGTTTVAEGTLTMASNLIASSPLIDINGGTLQSSGGFTLAANQSISGTGGSIITTTSTGLISTSGTTIQSSGILTITRLSILGIGNQITGGDIRSGGTGSTQRGLLVGNNGPGVLAISGGSLTSNGGATNPDVLGVIASSGNGTLTINGGTYINTASSGTLNLGNGQASGTLNVSSGSASIHTLRFHAGNSGSQTSAIVNLHGGSLILSNITVTSGLTKQFNFNGGVFIAGANIPAFSGLTMNVKDGGANIDTNGYSLVISDPLLNAGSGGLVKSGEGNLTLAGINTYIGNTTVSAGSLILADNAQLRFILGNSSGSNNSISGAGTVTLNGDFLIDTSAADGLHSGTWILENAPSLSGAYGSTFTVAGFTDAGNNQWTKTNGNKLYTFDETTGTLTLTSSISFASWISSHFPGTTDPGIIGADKDPDNDSIPNAVEMVIGGNPQLGMDTALLPTVEVIKNPLSTPTIAAGTYMLLTYRRSHLSLAAGIMSEVETHLDLSGIWTPVTAKPGVVIQVDENHVFSPPAASPADRVRVYVPLGSIPAQFGRLKAMVP